MDKSAKTSTVKLVSHIMALVSVTIWASTYIASKTVLAYFSPLQIMTMRFTVAYLVLLILKPKFTPFIWKDELVAALMGLFGCSLYFISENTALTITSTSNVSIIVAMAPILIALLAQIFTKDEKIKVSTITGFFIAFAGVILVVLNGTFVLKLNPLGDLLAFSSALSWAIYSILVKKFGHRFDNLIMIRKVMLYGLISTLPFVLVENRSFDYISLSQPKILLSILFLGIFGSGFCYAMWNVAVENLGVVVTNSYIYAIPFITMIVAAIVLHDKITVAEIAGALLIISGVVITGLKRKDKNNQKIIS